MVRRDRAPWSVVAAFAVAALAGVGFAGAYVVDLGNELLGGTIAVAFASLGVGLALWSRRLDEQEPDYVEERALHPSARTQWSAFEQALTEQPVPRVRVLWGMFGLALGTIGVALLFPLRSLWPRQRVTPDFRLSHTSWSPGRALVTEEGFRIRPDDLEIGGALPAFPEDDDLTYADAATMLVRVDAEQLVLPPERMRWVVDGVVAYSRLCTHAGCPVGLYADEYAELMCPCHHSVFDALRGARPVSGPAARALPQLPLGLDADGYLIALGDFPEPTGAGWWGFPG